MPVWMPCSGKGPESDPRDVFYHSPCRSPLWHSIIMMCVTVDSKTFWKMKQILFDFELSKAPTLCQILSRCLLNSLHSFELLIITDKQDHFQWPPVESHSSHQNLEEEFSDIDLLRLSTFYPLLEQADVLSTKLDYDMRFLQSLSFLLSYVA